MKYISLAVFALIYSSQVPRSNALLEKFFSNFGGKVREYGDEDQQLEEGDIVIEQGDKDTGEIIIKPYHKNEFESLGLDLETELSDEQFQIFSQDQEIQQVMRKQDLEIQQRLKNVESGRPEGGELQNYFENIEEENKEFLDVTKPVSRLDLSSFKQELLDQAHALNQDFLQQSQFQFAEYLGLSMIQVIFDRNLESPDFIEIFKSEDAYQPSLDAKLLSAQHIVEEKVMFFADIHSVYQTKLIDSLVDKFMANLSKKEETNGGFPDTESMKIALFGQLAFQYEQDCQDNYKKTQKVVLDDCTKAINNLLDQSSM